MISTNKYWNYATVAAIPIGICNILPIYSDYLFSSTLFSSISLFWKIATSFLILMFIGKKMVEQENEYTYGQSFRWCYLSCMLSSLIEGGLYVLYLNVVDPNFLSKTHNQIMQALEKSPEYNHQMLETVNTILNSYLTPSVFFWSAVMSAVFCGAIMSLIAAIVIKKKPDYSQDINIDE